MFRALQLLLAPGEAWGRIVAAKRGVAAILLLYLTPLLLICLTAEGYALLHWGERTNQFGQRIGIKAPLVLKLETVELLVGLAMVFAGAKMIQWIGESFHLTPPYTPCFTVTAYGLSPVFIAHLLNCIPMMNLWVSWALGAAATIFVLYQGVGIVLEPEPTKGFGLYVLVALSFTLFSGMAHLISLMILQGRLPF